MACPSLLSPEPSYCLLLVNGPAKAHLGHNWGGGRLGGLSMMGEPLVRVQLLGELGISLSAKAAGPWPRTSAKRLLALVFLSPGRRISKEVASDALFRDLSPAAATNAMHNALSAARGVLSDLGGPAAGVLQTDRTHIYIAPDTPVEVGLETHEGALRAALRLKPGDDRDAALVDVLVQGRTLLEDEAYSDWALRPRESLELARQEARLALARDRSAGFGKSGTEDVIEAWETFAGHDPASEEAASALMSAYAAEGQRHLVARAYRRCCDGLKDLGLEPSADLEQAFQRISQSVAQPRPAEVERAGNLPSSLSSFVGREAEQAEVGWLV